MKEKLSTCATITAAGTAVVMFLLAAIISDTAVRAGEIPQLFTINSPILPPYITVENDGFEDLLAKEAYGRLGIKIEIVHVPAERGLVLLDDGNNDGIMSRISGLDKKYPNVVEVKESVLSWNFVAFSHGKDIRITDWESLKPYSTAIIRGWKILERNIPNTSSLIMVTDARILFNMLNLDRVDLAVYALQPGLWTVRDLGLKDITPVMPPLAVSEKFFYVSKKHKDLAPKLAAALRAMKADGTYQRIRDQTLVD